VHARLRFAIGGQVGLNLPTLHCRNGQAAPPLVSAEAQIRCPRRRCRRQPRCGAQKARSAPAGIFDAPLPAFIGPQLAKLVAEAPEGERWAHELKFDGYRMHARIDRGRVRLITARSGLDWTTKYPGLADWLKALPVATAYLDGELCAVRPDGTKSFTLMQAATEGEGDRLVYFAFDLLHQDGEESAAKAARRAEGPPGRDHERRASRTAVQRSPHRECASVPRPKDYDSARYSQQSSLNQ
jgi:hypothetical protein